MKRSRLVIFNLVVYEKIFELPKSNLIISNPSPLQWGLVPLNLHLKIPFPKDTVASLVEIDPVVAKRKLKVSIFIDQPTYNGQTLIKTLTCIKYLFTGYSFNSFY